jgi:spore coat protein U-like protein
MRFARAIALGLGFACGSAQAVESCQLLVSNINVGRYNPFSTTPIEQTVPIEVRCRVDAPPLPPGGVVSVSLQLSSGNGSSSRRQMVGPANSRLDYNFYLPPQYIVPWSLTADDRLVVLVRDLNALNASSIGQSNVRIKVDAGQAQVRFGDYFDPLTVTLTF